MMMIGTLCVCCVLCVDRGEMVEWCKPSTAVRTKLKQKHVSMDATKSRRMSRMVKWKPFSSAKMTAPMGAPNAHAMPVPSPTATMLRISNSLTTLFVAKLPTPAPICPPIASIGPSRPTAIGLAVTSARPRTWVRNCFGPKLCVCVCVFSLVVTTTGGACWRVCVGILSQTWLTTMPLR